MYQYEKIQADSHLPIKLYDFYLEKESHEMVKHWHNGLEIVIPVIGSLNIWLNNNEFILPDGEILIINSRDIHQLYWTEDTDIYKGYSIQIKYDYIKKCCNVDGDIRFKQPKDDNIIKYLKKTIFRIIQAYEMSSKFTSILIESEIMMLLFILCNNLIEDHHDHIKSQKYKKQIVDMVDYLEIHYKENLSIEIVADHFNMSERYFSKFFKDHMGISPKKYLNLFRLKKVTDLLEETDYPVIDIAYANGFTSLSSFYNLFNHTFGKTPAEYRKDKTHNQ